jgi:hypothetical protein
MCNSCGKTKCCCVKVITERGPRGLAGKDGKNGAIGPVGPIGPTGPLASIPVANTVYVSKSGNDTTGLAERFDKPFLTLAAARVAAVALTPSAIKRILIVVEKGTYLEPIDLANYVDWNLGSSIINGFETGRATIDDFTSASVDSVIYGKADIRKTSYASGSDKSCVLIRKAGSNVRIFCEKISSGVGGAIEYQNGNLFIECKDIASTPLAGGFATGSGAAGNAVIHADTISSVGTCAGNGGSGTLTIVARELKTLSGTDPVVAVTGGNIRVNDAKIIHSTPNADAILVGLGDLVLKDTVIVASGTGYSVTAATPKNIKVYGTCYANKVTNNITAIVSAVTVDTDVS